MRADIDVEAVYPHPPGLVWQALTTSESLAVWFMPNDFAPVVGHRFTFRTEPAPGFDGVVHCEVLELDEPSRMVWSWRGGPLETTVTFTLEPLADGRTRFRMRQVGFHGLKARLTRIILESGSRRIYGRLLPAHLDGLAGKPVAPVEVTCRKSLVGALVWWGR
jgi:uncharacterized protein YndB with AHSA1/START domain